MLGYVAIGLPCGILSASIGLNALQVFIMCALFYSGAGQFMIPNMWLAGSPIASIILSVSFVNTRQMLYSAAFAPWCENVRKRLAFLFSATVTDESFGVNLQRFEQGGWSVQKATFVNAGGLSAIRNQEEERRSILAMRKYFGDAIHLKGQGNNGKDKTKSMVQYNISATFPF